MNGRRQWSSCSRPAANQWVTHHVNESACKLLVLLDDTVCVCSWCVWLDLISEHGVFFNRLILVCCVCICNALYCLQIQTLTFCSTNWSSWRQIPLMSLVTLWPSVLTVRESADLPHGWLVSLGGAKARQQHDSAADHGRNASHTGYTAVLHHLDLLWEPP